MPTPERFHGLFGRGKKTGDKPDVHPKPAVAEKSVMDEAELRRRQEGALLRTLEPLKQAALAWKAWNEHGRKGDEPKKPSIAEYQRITKLVRDIQDVRAGRVPLPEHENSEEFDELLRTSCAELETSINVRFTQFGKSETVTIDPDHITIPEGLTQEHLSAAREALGGGLKEWVLPTLEDLRHLDAAYVDVMYPPTQSAEDTERGLTSHRPNWWDKKVDITGNFKTSQTWGEAYLHSMRKELETIGGSLVLLDTAIKPAYIDGSQHYGSTEGTDASLDPILSLFQEAFGEKANRFNHTWDELHDTLLPLARKKIIESFEAKGLPIPDFKVLLVPSTLDNLFLTENPLSSSTNTWERSSTPLVDDDNNDTGRLLDVGGSADGGAGSVASFDRGGGDAYGGARLAVVFKNRD